MAERQDVERVARGIIEDASREFPGVSLSLDFETPRDDHEDAYLWITPGTDDREEINDIWGFVIQMVQDAFQEHDIYLVARMPGVGTIVRDRPSDAD
ncbi:MAG: hypothetical protein IIA91_03730 [Chloroflexi bacterium]|nr:hypothetical protein [Chloroflexota bacterium]